jgi:glutathione S-transferase
MNERMSLERITARIPLMLLHDSAVSGNCYKVRLLLTQLGIPFERREMKLRMSPEAATEFKKVHPLGRVPALVLDDGQVLAESNAILWYFAQDTPFFPQDRLDGARAMQWMFWEQYDHEPYVAVVRAWVRYFGIPAGKERELEERRARAYAALDVMERHLGGHEWFAGARYSIADIALFAYTHVCHEGEMSLERHGAIRAWIERVRAVPGHIALTA